MDAAKDSFDIPAIRAKLQGKMGAPADRYPVLIEQRFPRILARIADLWGTAELDYYLDDLMLSDREGRQGFPTDVATEFFRLIKMHGALGLVPKGRIKGWALVAESSLEKNALAKDE